MHQVYKSETRANMHNPKVSDKDLYIPQVRVRLSYNAYVALM